VYHGGRRTLRNGAYQILRRKAGDVGARNGRLPAYSVRSTAIMVSVLAIETRLLLRCSLQLPAMVARQNVGRTLHTGGPSRWRAGLAGWMVGAKVAGEGRRCIACAQRCWRDVTACTFFPYTAICWRVPAKTWAMCCTCHGILRLAV
jgi:hypothetical protein